MKYWKTLLLFLLCHNVFSQPGGAANWNLAFEDNFNGTTLDQSKWGYNYPWGHTHNHRAYMADSMVTLQNGIMTIKVIDKRHPDAPAGTNQYASSFGYLSFDYTSGAIHSNGKFNTTYGYIEGRFKIPSTLGTWPAFWTLNGDGAWPPEIDILEVPGDRKVHHFYYHYGPDWQNESSFGATHTGVDKSLDFHTYGVEWGPDYMKFYFDGQLLNSYTGRPEAAQGKNMYLLINLAVGGWAGDPPANAVFPALYQCDWVRVWKMNPTSNFDFETGTLSPWGPWNNATITTDCKRGGNYGVKLTGSPVSIERTVILEANTKYIFGGYGKVNTQGEHVLFGVKNYGGNQITKSVISTSFVKDSVEFTTGITNTSAVIFFYKDAGTGTVCGDDFFLYKYNNPPTVSITSPANNATFASPANITINASASDADGTVSNVQFFNGTTLLGTDATSPYSFTWSNVTAGTYALTAKATDNNGAVTKSSVINATVNGVNPSPFANGADVGWITEMEASGTKFYDDNGSQQDLFDILKGKCIDAIRLRVWVNPSGGWNNKSDVLAKAIRAKNKGFRIMIDFHYSDSWADPGQQNKPAAWVGHTIGQLVTDVSAHTTDIMNALKSNGITPEWVQVGNETNNGMLWEEGRASASMNNFALLVNSGYDAVKAVSPTSKVIVHISNGYDNTLFRWMFDGLKNNGAKWDVIGMSLYPTTTNWSTLTAQCLTNMNDMVARYNKEVMVVEVGMDVSAAATCNSFLTDILQKTKSVSGGKGLGVFYWEPQAYNGWKGYNMGAFDNTGKPTVAMNAFSNGCTVTTCSATISAGGATSFCQGGSVVLTSSTGVSYIWKNGTTQVGTAQTYTATGSGSYTVEVTNATACKAISVATAVIVNAIPGAPAVTTPVTYCQNTTATALTATGTALKWYTASTGGTGSAIAPTPVTTALGTINYYVSQTVNNCESARATMAITVNAIPAAPTVVSPVTYCQNTTATALTATGTALKWYTVSTGGTSSATPPTPLTTATGTINYYVSQTLKGCESARSTIGVTVNAIPAATITLGGSGAFCQGGSVTLTTGAGSSYIWFKGTTQVATSASYTASTSGNYTVEVSNAFNCKTTSSATTVTVNSLPTATITAGGPTTFIQGGSVLLSANTGTGLTYKWFNGTNQNGTGATYTATSSGDYTVEITNASSCKAISNTITITVNNNQLPVISITAPADNSIFTSPASVTLTASASDADGTITKVDFYNGSSLLGTDFTYTYDFTLNNLTPGTYTITGVATDNNGGISTSSSISFTVNPEPNILPIINITSPVNGNSFMEIATFVINASASDADGAITLVEFYNGTTLLGSDASPPYRFTWTNIGAGAYQITAKATDNNGGIGMSAIVNISVTEQTQTGIYSSSGKEISAVVYPNPSYNEIKIETSIDLEAATFIISDAFGSEVGLYILVEGQAAKADVSSLTSGIYTLLIKTDKFIIRRKIIVIHD